MVSPEIPPRSGGLNFEVFAVEINLRHGGTTHCFNMLKFITNGHYDRESGRFFNRQGQERVYYAVDVIRSAAYRGISPSDLIDAQREHGLQVGPEETGVVFHRLGSLNRHGKLGFTAFATSAADSERMYQQTLDLMDTIASNRYALGSFNGVKRFSWDL